MFNSTMFLRGAIHWYSGPHLSRLSIKKAKLTCLRIRFFEKFSVRDLMTELNLFNYANIVFFSRRF